ncbi:hypothetical protein FJZ31_13060 [Candidatus Poribacteria bacterium]|nr:hypothetical protein [Candidatus Poribacteria bacterium]
MKIFLQAISIRKRPLRSAYGICADLGPAPSAEEIDEMRREVFKNFRYCQIYLTVPSRSKEE